MLKVSIKSEKSSELTMKTVLTVASWAPFKSGGGVSGNLVVKLLRNRRDGTISNLASDGREPSSREIDSGSTNDTINFAVVTITGIHNRFE